MSVYYTFYYQIVGSALVRAGAQQRGLRPVRRRSRRGRAASPAERGAAGALQRGAALLRAALSQSHRQGGIEPGLLAVSFARPGRRGGYCAGPR